MIRAKRGPPRVVSGFRDSRWEPRALNTTYLIEYARYQVVISRLFPDSLAHHHQSHPPHPLLPQPHRSTPPHTPKPSDTNPNSPIMRVTTSLALLAVALTAVSAAPLREVSPPKVEGSFSDYELTLRHSQDQEPAEATLQKRTSCYDCPYQGGWCYIPPGRGTSDGICRGHE